MVKFGRKMPLIDPEDDKYKLSKRRGFPITDSLERIRGVSTNSHIHDMDESKNTFLKGP